MGDHIEVSHAERQYLEDGVAHGFRVDGRSLLDSRPFSVKPGVMPSCLGSASIQTADTDLIVGVKAELTEPLPEQPNSGFVSVLVDCPPSLSLALEGRGGEELGFHLATLVERLCLNRWTVDLSKLCVLKGSLVWRVFVDVMVLNSGGSLLDAISLGVRAALMQTILPKVEAFVEADEETDHEKVEFEVDDRPEVGFRFPTEKVPICITVGQIKKRFVWDLSLEEEQCAESKVTVAVDSSGACQGLHKTGTSTLELSALPVVVQNSQRTGLELHKRLNEALTLQQ